MIPQRNVTVHVFTDASSFGTVRDVFAGNPAIVVYDPEAARKYELPGRNPYPGAVERLLSPWLQWMRDATGEKPLDFVHFVTHGYLAGDQGAIAWRRHRSSTPTGSGRASSVPSSSTRSCPKSARGGLA